LLGAGESGKSTFLKQMKILFLHGFSNDEMEFYKASVIQNCIIVTKNVIHGASQLGIPIQIQENQDIAEELEDLDHLAEGILTREVSEKISQFWQDPGIQQAWNRCNEYKIQDTADYFIQNLKRISASDYEPTEQDILCLRLKTTGIVEIEFDVTSSIRFRVVDVGGQRSERKKWVNCFGDVTAVIFFVAMSEYDQMLREDENVNRMKESLSLWEEMANHKVFKNTTFILFLNKFDLFKKKIKRSPLSKCFPEYKGKNTVDAASRYIRDRFVELRHDNKKKLRCHFTCSTDTTNIKTVFDSVQEIILEEALSTAFL